MTIRVLQISQKFFLVLLLMSLIACTTKFHSKGQTISTAQISKKFYLTEDGVKLPLKVWSPEEHHIQSVIIAIHGFNDYSNFFQLPGQFLTQQNTISYAYDQRGFGGSPNRGYWAGVNTYITDLKKFISLIKAKHPELPVYLLGESMGGAIIISTVTDSQPPLVDGIILSAPAIWARHTMPWYQNFVLFSLAHTMPWLTLTGEGLNIKPSDNIEMLRALGKDPLVIKKTRVDAMYGLTNLMDKAFANANLISTKTLLLYGEKDDIIPKEPTYAFLKNLNVTADKQQTIALYKDGYHMLLRDLNAPIIWNDIQQWLNAFNKPLSSGADKRAQTVLNNR